MVWLLKSKYEKQSEKLRGKLLRIVNSMDSSELRQLCLNVIRKVPSEGSKLFDSDYNLIVKFSSPIRRDDYLQFFSHHHALGKFTDLKLAKYLIKIELFDEHDSDYVFVKESVPLDKFDSSDVPIIVEDNFKNKPRMDFPPIVKEKILKIQRFRCNANRCKFPSNRWRYLEFDHIKGREDNSIRNCQALCPFHHRLKSDMEWKKIRAEKEIVNGKRKTVPKSRTIRIGKRKSRTVRTHKPSRKFKKF